MFERFTEQARKVVVLAQEEARALNHGYIGTEHVLLGLLREEEGLAARALTSLDITLERVRNQVVRIVGRGEDAASGQIPFTPRATKVLELALREALSLGHNYIGPEHILLGLMEENDGVAARILLDFNVGPEKVRDELIRTVPGPSQPPQTARWIERRGGFDDAWLDGLEAALDCLAPEIRHELGREPDGGDLLLALACASGTTAGRVLRELGVDLDALWGTVERLREQDARGREQLQQRIAETRRAKQQALEAKDDVKAARMRDQERQLEQRARPKQLAVPELLEAIRQRLGIPTPTGS